MINEVSVMDKLSQQAYTPSMMHLFEESPVRPCDVPLMPLIARKYSTVSYY